MQVRPFAKLAPLLLLVGLLLPSTGCVFGTSPSTVNIELRKEKQALQNQIDDLQQKVAASEQVIGGLREKWPTVPTLPPERLDNMFTTHGLEVGRLTGGLDADSKQPGDEGFVVYINPVDEEGQPIKMVGTFTIEAFDLADTQTPLLGTWTYDIPTVRKSWRGSFLSYNYVLEALWQDRVPKHEEVTLKITFLDELTQTPFRAQQVIKIKPPAPPTQPASAPAG